MFTGIVEGCGMVRRVRRAGSGLQVEVSDPGGEWQIGLGQSVSVSGACLSVAGFRDSASDAELASWQRGADMLFELSSETLQRTWFSTLDAGRRVNLERALELGDRLDGHLVSGHVDAQGRVVAVEDSRDGGRHVTFEVDRSIERFLVDKGSITIDGVSLTVVDPRARRFGVALIPITLRQTNLGDLLRDQAVNLEVDMIGKWIDRLMPRSIG